MTTVYWVVCMDGNIRHTDAFATLAEAHRWAWWGHACAAHHEIQEDER